MPYHLNLFTMVMLLTAATGGLVQVQASSPTDAGGLREYLMDYTAYSIGATPCTLTEDSWCGPITDAGTGTNYIDTNPTGGSKAWRVTDTTAPYIARFPNTAFGVDLCQAGQSFQFDIKTPASSATTGAISTWQVTSSTITATSGPPNTVGVRITGAIGADPMAAYIRGSTGAEFTASLGTVAPDVNLHVLINNAGCTASAKATFTVTGFTPVVVSTPASISGVLNKFDMGVLGTVTSTVSTYSDNYDWNGIPSPPRCTSISPATGTTSGGTSFTITGADLKATPTIKFDTGSATAILYTSSTTVNGKTPAHPAGIVNVVLTNPDTQTSNPCTYEYAGSGSGAAPSFAKITPNLGPTAGGTSFTIDGTGFATAPSVTFDGVAATAITYVSSTQITGKTPAHSAGSVNIQVTNADGGATVGPGAYTYTTATSALPTITSVSPAAGDTAGGTDVTVNGNNFVSGASVLIDGVEQASIIFVSSHKLTFKTLPHTAGPAPLVVQNPDSTSDTDTFTFEHVTDELTLTSLAPIKGSNAGGTLIVLTGTGLKPGDTVTFGGVPATTITYIDATRLRVETPPHAAGLVDVTVTGPDTQTATIANGYEYGVFDTLCPVEDGITERRDSFETYALGQTPPTANFSCWWTATGSIGTIEANSLKPTRSVSKGNGAGQGAGFKSTEVANFCSRLPTEVGLSMWVSETPGTFQQNLGIVLGNGNSPTSPNFGATALGNFGVEMTVGQPMRLRVNQFGGIIVPFTPAAPAVQGNHIYKAKFELQCFDEGLNAAATHLKVTLTDLNSTFSGVAQYHSTSNVLSGTFNAIGSCDNANSCRNIHFDDLYLGKIPPFKVTSVSLAGVTGMDVRSLRGEGSVIVRYDGGTTVNTFSALDLTPYSSETDADCGVRSWGVSSRSYQVTGDGELEFIPNVAYIGCDSGHDSNVIKVRGADMGPPATSGCGSYCGGGGNVDIENCTTMSCSPEIDVPNKIGDLADLNEYPYTFSHKNDHGLFGNDARTVVFPFTELGTGRIGIWAFRYINNAGDQFDVATLPMAPSGQSVRDMCSSRTATKDYVAAVFPGVGLRIYGFEIDDDTDSFITDFSVMRNGLADLSSAYGLDCRGEVMGIVTSGKVYLYRWGGESSSPEIIASQVVSGTVARGIAIAYNAEGFVGAYIDGTVMKTFRDDLATTICTIPLPYSTPSQFRDMKMSDDGTTIWVAWEGGLLRYRVVGCTVPDNLVDELTDEELAAGGDTDGDGIPDGRDPVPDDADCDDDGITDGEDPRAVCRPDGCHSEDCEVICIEGECDLDNDGNAGGHDTSDSPFGSGGSHSKPSLTSGFRMFEGWTGFKMMDGTCFFAGIAAVAACVWLGAKRGGPQAIAVMAIVGQGIAWIMLCWPVFILVASIGVLVAVPSLRAGFGGG